MIPVVLQPMNVEMRFKLDDEWNTDAVLCFYNDVDWALAPLPVVQAMCCLTSGPIITKRLPDDAASSTETVMEFTFSDIAIAEDPNNKWFTLRDLLSAIDKPWWRVVFKYEYNSPSSGYSSTTIFAGSIDTLTPEGSLTEISDDYMVREDSLIRVTCLQRLDLSPYMKALAGGGYDTSGHYLGPKYITLTWKQYMQNMIANHRVPYVTIDNGVGGLYLPMAHDHLHAGWIAKIFYDGAETYDTPGQANTPFTMFKLIDLIACPVTNDSTKYLIDSAVHHEFVSYTMTGTKITKSFDELYCLGFISDFKAPWLRPEVAITGSIYSEALETGGFSDVWRMILNSFGLRAVSILADSPDYNTSVNSRAVQRVEIRPFTRIPINSAYAYDPARQLVDVSLTPSESNAPGLRVTIADHGELKWGDDSGGMNIDCPYISAARAVYSDYWTQHPGATDDVAALKRGLWITPDGRSFYAVTEIVLTDNITGAVSTITATEGWPNAGDVFGYVAAKMMWKDSGAQGFGEFSAAGAQYDNELGYLAHDASEGDYVDMSGNGNMGKLKQVVLDTDSCTTKCTLEAI